MIWMVSFIVPEKIQKLYLQLSIFEFIRLDTFQLTNFFFKIKKIF